MSELRPGSPRHLQPSPRIASANIESASLSSPSKRCVERIARESSALPLYSRSMTSKESRLLVIYSALARSCSAAGVGFVPNTQPSRVPPSAMRSYEARPNVRNTECDCMRPSHLLHAVDRIYLCVLCQCAVVLVSSMDTYHVLKPGDLLSGEVREALTSALRCAGASVRRVSSRQHCGPKTAHMRCSTGRLTCAAGVLLIDMMVEGRRESSWTRLAVQWLLIVGRRDYALCQHAVDLGTPSQVVISIHPGGRLCESRIRVCTVE